MHRVQYAVGVVLLVIATLATGFIADVTSTSAATAASS